MAELFAGGTVDPATHERTGDDIRIDADDLTTHGVIVGMTGSGKTGLGIVLVEEALPRGRAGAADRSEGRPHQPVPDVSRPRAGRLPTVGQRGRRREGGPVGRRLRRRAGEGVDRRARRLGHHGPTASPRCATSVDVHDLHAGLAAPASAINIVGSLQAPADVSDAEVVGDEIEGFVSGLLGLVGIDADPLSSREHILLSNLIHQRVDRRAQPRPADAGRHGPAAADPQARRVRARPVLPAEGPHGVRHAAQRSAGLAVVRRRGSTGPPLDIASMLQHARRQAAVRDRHHRAPQRRGAPVRRRRWSCRSWSRGCARQSGTTDLRALLYMDEVAGYLPPTADAADEEADHDADEAGPGVRRRRRAAHPEPGRRRLQGAVERRHVDDRAAADRPGQATPARRDERGAAAASTSTRSATRSPGWPSASSCCAAPARTTRRCSRPAGR